MLDSVIRPFINPSLDKAAEKIDEYNISANLITLLAFGIGLVGCFFVGIQSYLFGLIFILLSRVLAGVDGALARRQGATDFGAYLNIVCDLIFYAAFVMFFVMSLPMHLLGGLFLLFSYIGINATYLAYGIVVTKRGAMPPVDNEGSLFNAATLVENTEIVLFMIAACLFPHAFSALAFLFGLACWVAVIGRTLQAWNQLGHAEEPPAPVEDTPEVTDNNS